MDDVLVLPAEILMLGTPGSTLSREFTIGPIHISGRTGPVTVIIEGDHEVFALRNFRRRAFDPVVTDDENPFGFDETPPLQGEGQQGSIAHIPASPELRAGEGEALPMGPMKAAVGEIACILPAGATGALRATLVLAGLWSKPVRRSIQALVGEVTPEFPTGLAVFTEGSAEATLRLTSSFPEPLAVVIRCSSFGTDTLIDFRPQPATLVPGVTTEIVLSGEIVSDPAPGTYPMLLQVLDAGDHQIATAEVEVTVRKRPVPVFADEGFGVCGVDDGGPVGVVPLVFGAPRSRWPGTALSWSLRSEGCSLGPSEVTQAFTTAFAAFAGVAGLSFVQVLDGGNIRIRFGDRNTNARLVDPVLGLGAAPVDGRLLLRSDKPWTFDKLVSVAAHEIGHVIGLSHSSSRSSLMFPTFPPPAPVAAVPPGAPPAWLLDVETVTAIQALYGWPSAAALTDRATSHRPALIQASDVGFTGFMDVVHMAWRGTGDDTRIWHATSPDGTSWSPQTPAADFRTSTGPALVRATAAVSELDVLMAWKGHDDGGIYTSTLGPSGWSPREHVQGVGTSESPALAEFGGRPWMAWKGAGDDQSVFVSDRVNGRWTPQRNVRGVFTAKGPALVALGPRLFLFFRGPDDDRRLWFTTLHQAGAAIWEPPAVVAFVDIASSGSFLVPVASTDGPTATTEGSTILLAWKGAEGDRRIWFCNLVVNGPPAAGEPDLPRFEFTGQVALHDEGTSVGPVALGLRQGSLLAWKGVEGDNVIHVSKR